MKKDLCLINEFVSDYLVLFTQESKMFDQQHHAWFKAPQAIIKYVIK